MSPRPKAVLLCPGRGSYGRDELGAITRRLTDGPVRTALARADAERRAAGRPTISELDTAPQFRPGLHLEGRNAAELIYFATCADAGHASNDYEVLAVLGNSLGWYTALAVAGALSIEDGWTLVSTMAELQTRAQGGQVLTTTVDEDWAVDPRLRGAIDDALATTNARGDDHRVARSIRLGGHEVLAGTDVGVTALLEALPRIETASRTFPFRLAGHGPFHTELCADVAHDALARLGGLPMRAPTTHLIDGRGNVHSPWSADPAELLRYTLDTQVRTTFDFTGAVRCAMREFQPDVLVCLGPGTSLRAPVGHTVLAEGWRGIRSKAELIERGLVRSG